MSESRKRHRNDTWIDEVKIDTIIRWKESEVSGDEFRTSVRVQLIRKGYVLVERSFSRMQWAIMNLPAMMASPCPADQPWDNDALGQPAGNGSMCDQVGCKNIATEKRTLISQYCNCGHKYDSGTVRYYRVFCLDHDRRGDCSLEDADSNYEETQGPTRGDQP